MRHEEVQGHLQAGLGLAFADAAPLDAERVDGKGRQRGARKFEKTVDLQVVAADRQGDAVADERAEAVGRLERGAGQGAAVPPPGVPGLGPGRAARDAAAKGAAASAACGSAGGGVRRTPSASSSRYSPRVRRRPASSAAA
jgi:hypothetical protein